MGRDNTLNVSLPIYGGKKKKFLLSMNWYGTTHYRTRNNVKQEFHFRVGKILSDNIKGLLSPFKTHYKVYYKNKKSDAPNIVAVVDKFLMDALQEYNIIQEDNVQHYVASSWEVIGQDRINPRIEVILEEIR